MHLAQFHLSSRNLFSATFKNSENHLKFSLFDFSEFTKLNQLKIYGYLYCRKSTCTYRPNLCMPRKFRFKWIKSVRFYGKRHIRRNAPQHSVVFEYIVYPEFPHELDLFPQASREDILCAIHYNIVPAHQAYRTVLRQAGAHKFGAKLFRMAFEELKNYRYFPISPIILKYLTMCTWRAYLNIRVKVKRPTRPVERFTCPIPIPPTAPLAPPLC